jgi:hypothetical protein
MSPVNTTSRSGVPGEHDLPVGDADDQAVVRLAPGDRDEHEVDSADGQLLRLAHEMVRYSLDPMATAARQEVPEGWRTVVLRSQLGREVRLGDHRGAVRGQRVEASDVVKVRVGQDDVGDRQLGDLAKVAQGAGRVPGSTGGVDGDDPFGGDDEGEVGEVVALGHVDVRREFGERAGREPEPLASGHPVVSDQPAGPAPGRRRVFRPAEDFVGLGKTLVYGPHQARRELVLDREHELEVGNDGLGAARTLGEPGQRGSPEVVRQPEIQAGGRVQLGDRPLRPAVETRLERSGERHPERVSGVAVRAGREILEALLVKLGRHELAREHDRGAPVGIRPGRRLLERIDLELHGLLLHVACLTI